MELESRRTKSTRHWLENVDFAADCSDFSPRRNAAIWMRPLIHDDDVLYMALRKR